MWLVLQGGCGGGAGRDGIWRFDQFSWLTRTPKVDNKVNSEPDSSPKAAPLYHHAASMIAGARGGRGAWGQLKAVVGVHFAGFQGGGATQRTKSPFSKYIASDDILAVDRTPRMTFK
jgi:hypothetical protein